MQFRAGAFYIVLFLVVAAGAYGVIAVAEAPEATVDEADADYVLSVGDEFEVNGQVYNVTDLAEDSGTLESIEEDVTLEQEWEDGDTVMLDEDSEYTLSINQPEDDEEAEDENGAEAEEDENGDEAADDAEEENGDEAADDAEAQPTSFTLTEDYDEDEYETVEREDGIYVVVEEDGSESLIHIDDFDEIDSQTYELGDSIEYYSQDDDEMIDGEVADITTETVTVEYIGDEVTETDLEQGQTVTLNGEEFVAYFPGTEEVYLSSNVQEFQQQQAEVEYHHERIGGFWWVIGLSMITAIFIAGLAFMPVRG